jgi:site-specific DNA recombinase
MLTVIEEGGHTRGMTERMREFESVRKKVERLTEALNKPESRNEAAEVIQALVEKITLRAGPNRGEIDATLHGKLGTILGRIEAQGIGKTRKREIPAAFATGVSVSGVAGTHNTRFLRLVENPIPRLAA